MTDTRYIFDPQPGTNNFHDILAALVAVYPPLDSLDAIPERLRYMFREDSYVTFTGPAKEGQAVYKQMDATFTAIQATPVTSPSGDPTPCFRVSVHPDAMIREIECGTGGSGPTSPGAGGCAKVVIGPVKNCNVSLTGDAVKADDLGWIDTFKTDGNILTNQPNARESLSLLTEHATDDGALSPHDADVLRLRVLGYINDLENAARARIDPGSEVDRLRVESSNHAAQAEQYRRERDALKDEVERLGKMCDAQMTAAQQNGRERDAAIARLDAVSQDYQRRIGDLVLRAENAEKEVRRLSVKAGEF